jgi:hypothetical protein
MSMHVVRVHYFVCGYRLMFSCNLRILLIRQLSEDRSVVQHVCIVPLYIGISEYHVALAVATAVTTLDVIQMLDTSQN